MAHLYRRRGAVQCRLRFESLVWLADVLSGNERVFHLTAHGYRRCCCRSYVRTKPAWAEDGDLDVSVLELYVH